MAEDTADLAAALCTQAAMIMEDVLDSTLTLGHAAPDERGERLRELQQAADRIARLIAAAQALEG